MKASILIACTIFLICIAAVAIWATYVMYLEIGHPIGRKNYTSDKAKVKYDRNKAKHDKKFKKQQLNNILDGIIRKSNDKSHVEPCITVYNILPQNISELRAMGYEVKEEYGMFGLSGYTISWENGDVDP